MACHESSTTAKGAAMRRTPLRQRSRRPQMAVAEDVGMWLLTMPFPVLLRRLLPAQRPVAGLPSIENWIDLIAV